MAEDSEIVYQGINAIVCKKDEDGRNSASQRINFTDENGNLLSVDLHTHSYGDNKYHTTLTYIPPDAQLDSKRLEKEDMKFSSPTAQKIAKDAYDYFKSQGIERSPDDVFTIRDYIYAQAHKELAKRASENHASSLEKALNYEKNNNEPASATNGLTWNQIMGKEPLPGQPKKKKSKPIWLVEYSTYDGKTTAHQECFDNANKDIPISYNLTSIDNGDGTYRVAVENIKTTADTKKLVQAAEEYFSKNKEAAKQYYIYDNGQPFVASYQNLVQGYLEARIKDGIAAREAENKASGLEKIYTHQGEDKSFSWDIVTGRKNIDGTKAKSHISTLTAEETKDLKQALQNDAIEAQKHINTLAKIEQIKDKLDLNKEKFPDIHCGRLVRPPELTQGEQDDPTPPVIGKNTHTPEEFLDKPKKPRRKKILGLAIGKKIKDTGMGV